MFRGTRRGVSELTAAAGDLANLAFMISAVNEAVNRLLN